MCSSTTSLERLAEAVEAVRADELGLLTAAQLEERLTTLRRLADQVEAAFGETATAFEDTEAYKDVGARTAASWLRHHLRMTPGAGRRRMQLGRRLKTLPLVQQAFSTGDIGLEHAEILCAAIDTIGAKAVTAAEAGLVQLARLNDPADLRQAITTLHQSVDPDAADEAARKALDKRYFSLTPVGDEYVAKGVLDAETGAMMAQVLDTLSRPEAGDERSAGQRRVDALAQLCRSVLDAGQLPQDNGVRPHLTVTVSWDALVGRLGAAPARLDGFGAVSTSLVRRLACDAQISRVVVDPDGSPIELGRAARAPSVAQRRGAKVRDKGRCRVPGCRSRLAQLHHLVHWIDGGHTDLDNLVSVCPRHHRTVHSGRLRIHVDRGRVRVFAKDGRELTDNRDATDALVDDLTHKLVGVG
jgi:hypothetical protein